MRSTLQDPLLHFKMAGSAASLKIVPDQSTWAQAVTELAKVYELHKVTADKLLKENVGSIYLLSFFY